MATKKEKKAVPPKLNKFMHPRNPYKTPPSFKKLAVAYPEFRSHCTYDLWDKIHLDFKNPAALRALTTSLLHQDFGLQVTIPEGRLVPTLPLRFNYLLWLQDLLSMAARQRGGGDGDGGGGGYYGGRRGCGSEPDTSAVVGVDVGTGAACVYPLLGASHFGWCMLATETDSLSHSSAWHNVQQNELTGQVAVVKVEEKTILKGVLDQPSTLNQVSALRPKSGKHYGGGSVGEEGSKVHDKNLKDGSSKMFEKKNDEDGRNEKSDGVKDEEEREGEDRETNQGEDQSNAGNGNKKKGDEVKGETEDEEERREHGNRNGQKEEESKDSKTSSQREEREESHKEGRHQQQTFIYDFTMCNPPFFKSEEEVDTMAKSKKGRGEPCAAPTGSMLEKVTEGGEVEFIRQMVEESTLLRDQVRIFTTLIGTKAHVREVRKAVEAARPTSSVFTEFCQGRTMRWGAAWTFVDGVMLEEVRSKKEMATNKPIKLLIPRTLMSVYSVPAAWAKVHGWLKALKVRVEVYKSNKYFVSANVRAFKPTWQNQRQRRRREQQRQRKQQQQQEEEGEGEDKGSKQQQQQLQRQNGESSKQEDSEERSAKRKTEEEEEEKDSKEDEGLERKRARLATGDEEEDEEVVEEEEEEMDEDKEEAEDDEEEEEEVEGEERCQEKDGGGVVLSSWAEYDKPRRVAQKGKLLKCILRCNLQVKQTGGLISLEAYYLGGSSGRDGLNQMVQYMRNQLSKPSL